MIVNISLIIVVMIIVHWKGNEGQVRIIRHRVLLEGDTIAVIGSAIETAVVTAIITGYRLGQERFAISERDECRQALGRCYSFRDIIVHCCCLCHISFVAAGTHVFIVSRFSFFVNVAIEIDLCFSILFHCFYYIF